MTATDELRRMLDERMVEWWEGEDGDTTLWVSGGLTWEYHVAFDGLPAQLGFLYAVEQDVIPAQAIAATLKTGTCRDLGGTGANDEQVFSCSECGCVLSLYDRDGSNNLCTSFIVDYPRYCPECGRKVVDE